MMKNKKLLICMLALVGAAACVGGVGCGGDQEPQATIDIFSESEKLNVLGECALTATLENVTGTIVWQSSNPSVATVKDGVVTALNIGTTTITASIGGVRDTCLVEVIRSEESPVLTLSKTEVYLGKGMEYTVTASLSWLGKDVTDKVALDWSLGAGEADGIVSMTAQGNKAVFTGTAVGETAYYASANIGDAYVNGKISLTVNETDVSFDSTELAIGNSGKFEMTIGTKDENGVAQFAPVPNFSVYAGGETVDGATLTWESSNQEIAKIENGKITAVKAGVVELYGHYNDNYVTVLLNIERGIVKLDETLTFDLRKLEPQAITATLDGVGEQVELNGKTVGFMEDGKVVLDKKALPTSGSELGTQELVVYTDQVKYKVQANLYSMIINTAEELNSWYDYAIEADEDGYYVLGGDIIFNDEYTASKLWNNTGYQWANPDNAGFAGVFDGQGYKIEGMHIARDYSAFITLLRGSGVIKNVSFIEAKLSGYGGIVCMWGCGLIENVYVQFTSGTVGKGGFAGAFMATDNHRDMQGDMTIRNCFINAAEASLAHATRGSWIGGYVTFKQDLNAWVSDGEYALLDGVYVLAPSGGQICINALAGGSENYGVFTSLSALVADENAQAEIATWDSTLWVVEDGMPVIDKTAAAIERTYETANVYAEKGETTLKSALIEAGKTYSVVAGAERIEVTAEKAGEVNVTFTSLLSGKNKVVLYLNTLQAVYYPNVIVATKVITTFEDLTLVTSKGGVDVTGYYVLGGDIDAQGQKIAAGAYTWNKGFKGFFEGQGYTISNLVVGQGGIFNALYGATVRNVNFENVSLSDSQNYVALLGSIAQDGTTIENISVQFSEINVVANNILYDTGLLICRQMQKTVWRNITIDASGLSVPSVLGSQVLVQETAASKCTFENVLVKAAAVSVLGYTEAGNNRTDATKITTVDGVTVEIKAVNVTVPASSEYYTFSGANNVTAGETYTFTVTPKIDGLNEFIVFVNGEIVTGNNGTYTIENAPDALEIKVIHGYIICTDRAKVSYGENGVATVTDSVYVKGNGRDHGHAYIMSEYVDYMMSQGYTKIKVYLATTDATKINQVSVKIVDSRTRTPDNQSSVAELPLVAGEEIQFWGQLDGSGSKIYGLGYSFTVSGLEFA